MADRIKVVVTIDISEALLDELRRASPRLCIEQNLCDSEQDVARALSPGSEILYTRHFPSRLKKGSRLKWIQFQSAGIDYYLNHPVYQSSVIITTTSGAHAGPAAEFVLGLMIALVRNIPQLVQDQQRHCWNSSHSPEIELRGKTIGILGYGSIGRQVARLADALGMRILAVKRDPQERRDPGYLWLFPGDPEGTLPERIYPRSELKAMLKDVDFLVITAPHTRDTESVIGEIELQAMRPTSYLINVGRGPLVNMSALACALRERWIRGACVDVFEPEPLATSSEFWDAPNLLITPHVLASRDNLQYDKRCNEIFAENLRRFVAGEPLWNQVRKDLGY